MTEKKKDGLWDLIKELAKDAQVITKNLAKEAPGITKELTAGLWDLSKELAKEAPGLTKDLAKETLEGVKSYSENAKADAHKFHLEHIEKMKKLEKRAKDAGISEVVLAIIKKDLGVTHEEPADTQREFEGSANLLDIPNYALLIARESLVEEEFAKRLEPLLTTDNSIAKFTLDQDVAFDEGSVKDAGISEEYLAKLKKDFGVTPSEPENSADTGSSQKNFNQSEEVNPYGINSKDWKKESDSKPIFNSFFSSLIEKYLSNYQAIERGEILQGNVIPHKVSHNNFRAVCRGEKKAVTAHEQAYMAWKKLGRPPEKGSTETTINVDLP